MRDKGLIPAVVLCSAARRALETWDLVAPFLGGRSQVKILRSLYLAAPSRLLAVVQRTPGIRVIVFYDKEYLPQFEALRARLPVHHALAFPVDEAGVRACLLAANTGN